MVCKTCKGKLVKGSKYCSAACYQADRKKRNTLFCPVCLGTYTGRWKQFCSRECALIGKRQRGRSS